MLSNSDKPLILAIEDEPNVSRFMKLVLERHGFQVLVAGSGEQAVDLFRHESERIALVILDCNLPGLAAETTLELLSGLRPGLPVLLTSGGDPTETAGRFPSQGTLGFIPKPFTTGDLVGQIRRALGLGRAARG